MLWNSKFEFMYFTKVPTLNYVQNMLSDRQTTQHTNFINARNPRKQHALFSYQIIDSKWNFLANHHKQWLLRFILTWAKQLKQSIRLKKQNHINILTFNAQNNRIITWIDSKKLIKNRIIAKPICVNYFIAKIMKNKFCKKNTGFASDWNKMEKFRFKLGFIYFNLIEP